ncbi:MAG: GNAT family N-acetyltransferase [Saprospiraceae bacterium]|nr:GNAT family N-acetyltransferase [Saprospiraceae bacterium]
MQIDPIDSIEILGWDPSLARHFADLNYTWIIKYFKIEETDRLYLDNPQKMIIDKGGQILFIKLNDQIAGTVALIPTDPGVWELSKMAIDPMYQGHGLGYRLGLAAIDAARAHGAHSVFLESNTVLAPAINLYRKLGFVEIPQQESPYERSNIQMSLKL